MLDSCGDGRDNGEVEEGMRHFVPPFSFDSSLSHPYSCAILCRSVRRGEELEVWLRVAGVDGVGWSFSCRGHQHEQCARGREAQGAAQESHDKDEASL
jgi:hypothetical protein